MIIRSGTGTPNAMEVDKQGRAHVIAATQPLDQYININNKKVFSLPFTGIDPVGAGDYFIYIKNTGITDLRLTDVRLRSTVVGTVSLVGATGTASFTADVDITPVNRTIGSSNTITLIAKTDTNTTGLTSTGVLFYVRCNTADKQEHLSTSSNIVIPPGQILAFSWSESTGILDGVISLVEAE